MSAVTVEQIGSDFPGWLIAVQHGDTVAFVDAGREIGPLVPQVKKDKIAALAGCVRWPDFAARQRYIFGDTQARGRSSQCLPDGPG